MADIYAKDVDGSVSKRWGSSRTAQRVNNNLGIIWGGDVGKVQKFRRQCLEDFDAYYECRQYDNLIPWDDAAARACEDGDFIGVRKRQPRINYAYAKTLASRIVAKLVSEKTFPRITVEEDPDTTEFLKALIEWAELRSELPEALRRGINTGSVLLRFSLMGGAMKVEHFLSKYCYPEFDPNGELSFVKIQYTWTDYEDLDEKGKPREKWYRLDLGRMADILYDNPPYSADAKPEFQEVERAEHGFGFVQAVWYRTSINKHNPDGEPLVDDLTDFIDEINYSMSQSSQAVSYNQEPQLTVSGMDMEELDHIIRSSSKALNLGRDGKAAFLESNMSGVETADKLRDKVRNGLQEISRVVMLDPEKIVGSAQSGKAMEVLHGPMLDLIDELRPMLKKCINELLLKMSLATLIMAQRGEPLGMEIPPGWRPKSLEFNFVWPEIFPMTIEDLQKKVAVGVAASSANILSRESVTRWLAQDFGIEDIEAEVAKVDSQKVINPFGGF